MDRHLAQESRSDSLYLPLSIAAGLVVLLIGGAGLYGWIAYGSSIFLAMAETGLSWCM